MAKVSKLAAFFPMALIVLFAGCTDQGGGTVTTPTGCGDKFCGVGETSTNCPVDCGTEQGGSQGYKPPSSGKYDAPELELEIDDIGVPSTIRPDDQVFFIVRVKNAAKQSMSEEENQRLTIRNVEVSMFNFGEFLECNPTVYTFSSLRPEEEREVSCTITAPRSDYERTIKVRATYTYDLYASLDDIEVLSEDEYKRQRPSPDVIETTVSGPLTMKISATRVPVQEDRPLTIAVDLEEDTGKKGGIITKRDLGVEYHAELFQVQIPEEFVITSPGLFSQTGNTLTASKIRLGSDGTRSFRISLTAPQLSTPMETYSLSAVATGFDLFVEDSIDLKVVGE
jgi:hypothetical protein